MAKEKIVILGAGFAGLSAALHLQRKKRQCQIFEKESEPGGLCRSKVIEGFTFDYDGHLLHFRHPYTFKLIKSLLGKDLVGHRRSAWVYSCSSYTRYPFQANLYGLSPSIAKECLLGLIEASTGSHIKKHNNINFLDWIYLTFGKGIARHFMIPYNTKFWTLSPQDLTCSWLDGFIPVPSLSQTIEGALKENRRQFGYNTRFWYPRKGGIGQVTKVLASHIRNIHTNCCITHIDVRKKELKFSSGCKEKFDWIISTIPLPDMPYIIKEIPERIRLGFGKLRWNSVFNLNLGIKTKEKISRHWIYFPQEDICFFRVGFFHNFSSFLASRNNSSLYIEVSYSKDKPLDKSRIILRIKEDLEKIGILNSEDEIIVQDINDIKYAYPIYDKNYCAARQEILNFLIKNSIIPCGRYGSWSYMSMEGALLDGKDVADRLSSYQFRI